MASLALAVSSCGSGEAPSQGAPDPITVPGATAGEMPGSAATAGATGTAPPAGAGAAASGGPSVGQPIAGEPARDAGSVHDAAPVPAADGSAASGAGVRCAPRAFAPGPATLHMHHVHFNTIDEDASIAFVERYFGARAVDFCSDETSARATRAIRTERAYFLYTETAAPPASMRTTRLAHVGWNTSDVAAELMRMLALDVPLADPADACESAAQGTPCNTFNVQWFYVDDDNGARFEVASGPGPSTSGFGHIHLVMPDYTFYEQVLGDALQDVGLASVNVDGVNITNSGRSGMLDPQISYQPTRGSVLDHIAYSTTELEAAASRIEASGIALEEPISFKPEYGFRSFFVKSAEGVWLEIVEDGPYADAP